MTTRTYKDVQKDGFLYCASYHTIACRAVGSVETQEDGSVCVNGYIMPSVTHGACTTTEVAPYLSPKVTKRMSYRNGGKLFIGEKRNLLKMQHVVLLTETQVVNICIRSKHPASSDRLPVDGGLEPLSRAGRSQSANRTVNPQTDSTSRVVLQAHDFSRG